jgi:hypothetical protein
VLLLASFRQTGNFSSRQGALLLEKELLLGRERFSQKERGSFSQREGVSLRERKRERELVLEI